MPAIHRARSRGELALVGRLPPSPAMVCTIPLPSVKPGVRVWGVSWGRWAGRCRRACVCRRADVGDLPYNSWNDDGYMNMYASESRG
jgi:hypothetical protein